MNLPKENGNYFYSLTYIYDHMYLWCKEVMIHNKCQIIVIIIIIIIIRNKMFYLTTHSKLFIYGYMVFEIW